MSEPQAQPPAAASLAKRRWAGAGALLAVCVALVFTFVGDGVETRGNGIVRTVIAHGHSLTWVLLAASLAAFAIPAAPRRLSTILGYLAIASYVAFLAAVLMTPQTP